MIKFNLQGVATVFGIQQMVTAHIENNQKMGFIIKGKPFSGVFDLDLQVNVLMGSDCPM